MQVKLEKIAGCTICGKEDESGYHDVVRCTKAIELRYEMRKYWLLPVEKMFTYIGPDWVLLLMCELDETMKAKVLLLLWRAWHLRNDIIHRKGAESIIGSASFLVSHDESLEIASHGTLAIGAADKGKVVMFPGSKQGRSCNTPCYRSPNPSY
jgi:hypothetical protein